MDWAEVVRSHRAPRARVREGVREGGSGNGAPRPSERGPPNRIARTSSTNSTATASLIMSAKLKPDAPAGTSGKLSSLFFGGGSGAGEGMGLPVEVELFRDRASNPTILSFTDPTFDPIAFVPDFAVA